MATKEKGRSSVVAWNYFLSTLDALTLSKLIRQYIIVFIQLLLFLSAEAYNHGQQLGGSLDFNS